MKFIFRKLWTRALQLYIVGVSLTFLFLVWALMTHHTTLKDALPQPFDWSHYSTQILLMRYTYGWADFLVRFAILMLIAPFVFYLVAKRLWWLALAASLTAWFFRGQGFTLAWQLIFNSGIIIGFYWSELENRFRSLKAPQRKLIRRSVATAAGLTFAISYSSIFALSLLFHLWGADMLPHWWQHIAYVWGNWNYDIWRYADKWTMGPIRLVLFCLWFPVLYWLMRRYEYSINIRTKGILELLGRNSLFVYTAHAFIVFIFKLYLIPPKTSFLQNFLITGLAIVLLVLVTLIYKKIRSRLPAYNARAFNFGTDKAGGRI